MPILKNAQKALRASKRKTTFNRRTKSIAKTAIDSLKTNPSAENLRKAQSAVDKAVKKNIIGGNKAARVKANLYKLAKKAKVKLEVKTKTKPTAKKKTPAKVTAKKKTSPAKASKSAAKK